nr:hypothetical protein [Streptomyces griseus]
MARTELPQNRRAAHVCPVCKHPVATVVTRHKTLGIFVPEWGPGSCRNPACPGRATKTESHGETTER